MIPRCPSFFAISILCSVATITSCTNQLLKQGEAETTSSSSTSGAGGAGSSSSSASSSGQSSSSGQGGQGTCTPASMPACPAYDGPAGTENVGTCLASKSICQGDGTWSPCDQPVLPNYESCSSVADENCDGLAPCTGKPIDGFAAPAAQSAADELILAMATGDSKIKGVDGPVYLAGTRAATLNPPPGTNHRVFVSRKMPDGAVQDWSNQFSFMPSGGSSGALATGVAVLPKSGDIVIAGLFYGGTLMIGGAGSQSATTGSAFFARFTPTGSLVKVFFPSGSGTCYVRGISADGADNIYAAGSYAGTVVLNSTQLPIATEQDGLAFSLSPDFGHLWHQTFAGPGSQSADAIATIDDSAIAVATTFTGTMSITNASGNSAMLSGGSEPDVLIARLRTSDGKAQWLSQIAGSGTGGQLEIGGLAANATTIAIGGKFTQTVSLAGVQYLNLEVGAYDSFIATLAAQDGAVKNQFVSQAIGSQEIRSIAIDSSGDLILAGHYSGSFPLPGQGLATSAGVDAFVIKTDAQFNGRWAVNFGDASTQVAYAATVGKTTGRVFAAGGFQGMMDVGGATLTSAGGLDAFLVQLGD